MIIELFGESQKAALVQQLHQEFAGIDANQDVVLPGVPSRRVTSVRINHDSDTDQTRVQVDRLIYLSELVMGKNEAYVRFAGGYKDQFFRHRGVRSLLLSGAEYAVQAIRQKRLPEGLPAQVHELQTVLDVVRAGKNSRRTPVAA